MTDQRLTSRRELTHRTERKPPTKAPLGRGGARSIQFPTSTELDHFTTLTTSIDIARALFRFKDSGIRAELARRHPDQRAACRALSAIEQLEQRDTAPEGPTPRPLTREAPLGEAQLDFLVPFPHDIASKDALRLMECAPFRLGNRQNPQQKQLTYVLGSAIVEFIPNSQFGLPTARDYDFVQFICSHLQEAVNRGGIPDRTFVARGYEFLRFARREQGGKQHDQIEPMIDRLQGTVVKRYSLGTSGERGPPEWLPLVGYCKVLSYTPSGKVDQIRVDIPLWLYEAIVGNSVRGDRPHVLTLNRDYYPICSRLRSTASSIASRATEPGRRQPSSRSQISMDAAGLHAIFGSSGAISVISPRAVCSSTASCSSAAGGTRASRSRTSRMKTRARGAPSNRPYYANTIVCSAQPARCCRTTRTRQLLPA
ncbi:MAG: replication initiator protein A [Myxococcota bacterium]